MASGLMGTAVSALLSSQQALNTTGHNIANVNTEGYSRQRVELTPLDAKPTANGYMGAGVQIANIGKVYDQFLVNQVRTSTSAFSELDSFHKLAASIDGTIGQTSAGIGPGLSSFFSAMQRLASDPTSTPMRQNVLSEADALASQFGTLDNQFSELGKQVNQGLGNIASEINDLSGSLAAVNGQILSSMGTGGGQPPNDLLDQRDNLLTQLAKKVDVTALPRDDGSVDVFIGNGQSLVLKNSASTLGVVASATNPNHLDITLKTATGTPTVVTRQMSGGELGGTLKFRAEVLDPARNQLGLVAAGVTNEFNALHRTGFDLSGGTGNAFFRPLQIGVTGAAGGTVTATFNANTGELKASDYRLTVGAGGNTYTLTRLSDQQVIGSGNSGNFSVDGMDISVAGVSGGESFLIRPTFGAAGRMAVDISDPRQIAAAASDTSSGGTGDNRIALQLSALQEKATLLGGTASFQQAFGQLVTEVGTRTQSAKTIRTAQEGVLNQAIEARESVSGVNLDEEAANLLKFQQAYQAAAQVVTVANTVFDALLGAVRG